LFARTGSGEVTITIEGDYLENAERDGLAFSGGTTAGNFSESFTFEVAPGVDEAFELSVPVDGEGPTNVWEMRRLAVPLPTLMPSYNQIGFDSLHYLIGLVELTESGGVAWVIEALPDEEAGRAFPAIGTQGMFAFAFEYDDEGHLTFQNDQGASLVVLNAPITFDDFRISVRLDENGAPVDPANVTGVATCGSIEFYGEFLRGLGLCNPTSDQLVAFGAAIVEPWGDGSSEESLTDTDVTFERTGSSVEATLSGTSVGIDDVVSALVLVDTETGLPLSFPYGVDLVREADEADVLRSISLPVNDEELPDSLEAYLMLNTYPAASATLERQGTLE
ncbi:MAG: hypothetical protein KC561_18530, partial [Myxococcales bacterium]|nr:hypothetical protein [Myxococcales bacterium]